MADLVARAHVNLVESTRRLFELDPDAEVEAGDGWLFGAGSFDHPAITNTAFRLDDAADPGELIARAKEWFGSRGRGFCLWVRDGVDEDAELGAACQAEGLPEVYAMPEMVLDSRIEPYAAENDAVRRLRSADEAAEFWRVAAAAYSELGFPAEMFAQYKDGQALLADDVAVFVGEVDGAVAAIAMTIVAGGVAGIYWVGSLPAARGRGLGRAVTTAATLAGLDLGGEFASLQASPMGRPIYEAMGYRTIYDYRLRACPPPSGG